MQRIAQSRHEPGTATERAPDSAAAGAAPSGLLAFVSLARLASGEGGVSDVLALGSSLLADVLPGATGAWYLPDGSLNRIVVVDTFGPAAHVLRGDSVAIGERLTGWVAANRQPIINSDAALDLATRVNAVSPPLSRCISVPLMVGDALIAVLTLYTAVPDGFSADHGRLIQIVAPHLAGAIDIAVRTEAAVRDASPGQKPGPRDLRLVASR
jgi:GAF domain-containing protein